MNVIDNLVKQINCISTLEVKLTYRLYKQQKLIKTDEFSSVFNFRKRISSQHFAIHYQPNSLLAARLGLVIGKKTAKLAVHRNYMRRVLREFFRIHQHEICPVDLVIRVQKKFSKADFLQAQVEFETLVDKVNRRFNHSTQLISQLTG